MNVQTMFANIINSDRFLGHAVHMLAKRRKTALVPLNANSSLISP